MSYEFYVVMHLSGIVLSVLSIGALSQKVDENRKMLSITHGVGLILTFIAGFGLMAKTGLAQGSWPTWIYIKLLIWLIFGASLAVFKRAPALATRLWWIIWVLFIVAAYIAKYKPI